jgi:hypothetical protein
MLIRSTADRGDERDLVAVGEGSSRVGVFAVARESDRGAAGGKDRVTLDDRGPGCLDRGTRRQIEIHLARPGKLTLEREEPDPDAHGGQPR